MIRQHYAAGLSDSSCRYDVSLQRTVLVNHLVQRVASATDRRDRTSDNIVVSASELQMDALVTNYTEEFAAFRAAPLTNNNALMHDYLLPWPADRAAADDVLYMPGTDRG